MVTDHLLIRRAAVELDNALRGSRVRDVGLSDQGHFALSLVRKGSERTLFVDAFGNPPLFWTASPEELSLSPEPAWTRAIGATLRGLTLLAVRARRGDRVIALELGARSRFGVETASRLVIELVPRFGNVLLLKGETIVAAAKTFSPAENQTRSVEVGRNYVPPPLPLPRVDREGFTRLLNGKPETWSKALGAYLPGVPRLLAVSLALEAAGSGLAGEPAAAWFEARAAEIEALTPGTPVRVYRRAGALVQAHLVGLRQFDDLEGAESAELVPLFREAATTGDGRSALDPGPNRLRARLERGFRRRLDAVTVQLERLRVRRAQVEDRDGLRRAGDALYAYGHDVPAGATSFVSPDDPGLVVALDPELDAKANAAHYFARYRKASDAVPHLVRRLSALERERDELDTMLWEVERADPQVLAEIAGEAKGTKQSKKPRRIEAVTLPSGARVYLGRSPRENVEVTFSIARPNDFWFHARNVPGAHVVLAPPGGDEPSDTDILTAAAMAAAHSRAKSNAKVEVDYTRRKHVRKQRDAGPGMVWYTDFKTVLVAPE